MREQEFRAYMRTLTSPQGAPLTESNMNFYANACINVEQAENINLDEAFQTDSMAGIYNLYKYSAQDKHNNLPNPTNMELHREIYAALSDIRSALNHYRRFCLSAGDAPIQEAPDSNDDTETIAESDSNTTFGLERDMQDAIRETITQLESGLEIIDGGVERKVVSGFIDILAKDSNGAFVVIELKAGKASDSVIAQTLGYMVDIADAEGLEINQVRGIIVAKSFNKRIETAARAVPTLALKAYTYSFDFN